MLFPKQKTDVWSPTRATTAALIALLAVVFATVVAEADTERAEQTSAFDFSFTSIDGEPLSLAQFEGRPLVVVNTASRCGFTHQYDGLQALWERYRDRGLVLIGAPSDNFNQELATEAAVKEFCEVNFALDFPMTEVVEVRGPGSHPFFAWAAEKAEAPKWNFYKYVVGADGRMVASFPSSTPPQSRKMIAAVEDAFSR